MSSRTISTARAWRSFASAALLLGLSMPGPGVAQDYAAKGFQVATPTPREATPANLATGKEVYGQYCSQCHGDDGDGAGAMADLLTPRPRDFRRGVYKIRRTMQGELPVDDDLFQIITRGMPGTSMPAWEGILTPEQIWQLVDYIKTFSLDFDDFPAEQEFLLQGKPEATPESIERGAALYVEAECAKCHGASGRGNGPSAAELEDEWENKIVPADLTQPWTMRGGSSVEDYFRTLTTGLNGTPMPSFSDAFDAAQLWDLANYLDSMGRQPAWGEIVRAPKTDTVPDDPDDPAWEQAPAMDIRLAGQIIQEPRLFNPAVQSLRARALFDDDEVGLLVSWTDRFENDGQGETPSDQLAVLFPAQKLEKGKKPYFLMGDRRRQVDAWEWSAASGTRNLLARGSDSVTPRESSLKATASYKDGEYRVILRRSLATGQEDEVEFTPGQMVPIAWNVWEGDNGEQGKQRAISRWYYLLLEPKTPWTTWLWPLVIVSLAGGGEAFGMRRLRRRWAEDDATSQSQGAAES